MADLESLHAQVRACVSCGLHATRTQAVPGEGSPRASVMFVGEGPGFNEDRQGRPFVGAAGKFLDEMLADIGLDRGSVFITNMVKCRPPNNRDPFPGEMEACAGYLDAQIAAIQPKVIVPLGRHALAKWFPDESIGRVRAQPRSWNGVTLFPLYHPAAALHSGNLRNTIVDDFKKLGGLLASLEQRSPAPPAVLEGAATFAPEAVAPETVGEPQLAEASPQEPAASDPPAETPVATTPSQEPIVQEGAPEPPQETPGQQLSMF